MKKLFTLGPQYHGTSNVIFAWQPNGNHVASIGEGQRNLFLFDRRGMQVEEVALKSTAKVLQLEWDRDGEILAVLQQNEGSVMLWRHAEKKLEMLELHSRDPSYLSWSKTGPHLTIGTIKGSMMIYNKRTSKKQTIMGKHSRRISCVTWHPQESLFASGSEDKTITLSTEDGDPVRNEEPLRLKNEPGMIQFSDSRSENPNENSREKTVSVVLGDVTLLLFSTRDVQKPTELAFQSKYGTIRAYCWYGDSYIILGFSLGYVVVISTHAHEISEELSSVKYHQNNLDSLCCSKTSGKIASAGDDGIRIIKQELRDWKEVVGERIHVKPEARVIQMYWSEDGELLSFCTDAGWVYCYLTKLAALSATCNTRLAYLTSLREMTIIEGANESGNKIVLQTDVEPAFVSLGPQHLATGMNNRIWFYYCASQGDAKLVNEQEYIGTVESVSLNATHACVLIEGRIYLHPIERSGGEGKTTIFPRKEDDRTITCASIVGNFLIYAHANGRLQYYSLVDYTDVNEYKHENAIKRCYPNHEGTRCILIDKMGSAWLYSPVNDDCLAISDFPVAADRVLWDTVDSSIFAVSDASNIYTFIYTPVEVGGSGVRCLGNVELGPEGELRVEVSPTSMLHGQLGVLLVDGTVVCQQSSGLLSQMRLRTHEFLDAAIGNNSERQTSCFRQALGLNRFSVAFRMGLALRSKDLWIAMGRRCLECLEVSWAKLAYRQAPSPGMVLFLNRIQAVEDKQLLSGHVACLLGHFHKARDYFLQSCCPEAALDMHCDFLQWEQALSLAQTLAPQRLSSIYLKSAHALEAKGDQTQALAHFEQACRNMRDPEKTPALVAQSRAGIARTSILLGDLGRGMEEALALKDPAVYKDCAQLLAKMRQNVEAAKLYEEAGAYEQAASHYILDLNFDAAAPLMSKIHTPKLHLQFAKAKESRGAYREALVAYERARDLDSVIRLCLENLSEPQKAFALVRETQIPSGAERVANYCKKQGNIPGAVEFLLLAKNDMEAFTVAERHDEMSTFEAGIGENGTIEQHKAIASYYERRSMFSEAARHYALCQDYATALQIYLKAGEKDIDKAIDVVGKARSDPLTHMLIDYLMGESDNIPKDPNYVYRLHKALGNYMQAAGTALIIAKQEQEMGNYKIAHQLLFRTYQDLKAQKLALPHELWRRLMVLHSYVIVKRLVKQSDHMSAARMLLRVARNIQQFPAHVVPILTSVVIECQRAKMYGEAYQYACQLMSAGNRAQVAEQYRKKIENIVRKKEPEKQDEFEELTSPCMYCGAMLNDSQLDCSSCKNISPFCIISGMRMLRDGWSYCPSCRFPARLAAFTAMVAAGDAACPMCDSPWSPAEVPSVADTSAIIQDYRSMFQAADPAAAGNKQY